MAMPKMGRCQGFTLGLTTDYKCGGQGLRLRGGPSRLVSVVGCWGWQLLGVWLGVGWCVANVFFWDFQG